jgi:hypothetical protein
MAGVTDEAPIVVPLQYPITVAGETVAELKLHRPRAKNLWEMDAVLGEQRKLDALLASVAGATLREIGELDAADRVTAQEALLPFLGSPSSPTASA